MCTCLSLRSVGVVFASAALVAGGAMLAGLTQNQPAGATGAKSEPEPERPAMVAAPSMLDAIKKLEGTWTTDGPDGKQVVASIYKVTAGGSAVREIMFPGSAHEMTNMYHLDRIGKDGAHEVLVVTHYCAAGNQPRMQCVKESAPGVFPFEFRDVTNLRTKDEGYMGGLTLTITDADHAVQEWTHFKEGKVHGEKMQIELTRQK